MLCLSCLCLANEGIRVCACVPRWIHRLLEDALYDRMWKQSFYLMSVHQLQNVHAHLAELSQVPSQLAFIAARLT